jgi:hypothetical protein
MSITEIDRLLTDARREAEHDLSDYEWRLIRALRDAINETETDDVQTGEDHEPARTTTPSKDAGCAP